ncbi:phosphonate transport system ATP-binding protein [Deinococcus metalli]|uniref:Phosphonate transport system ATP-binding protein n=1 Tax=Deinococcus metalli TaxID=1141878 RepID=A0A7W8NUB1_9DEIO|nr:phosphonate ABC transporter ATP-binding protein [Deinococcus metalli]MBB5379147.1 phosphonate transport system ATP-binding protein [Deinococcus metalli]GHF64885.1 phosphonates import ATP-binding protein PhnC [Deinococcus metalli]
MIETRALHVAFRGRPALHDVSVAFGGGFTAIIGPSGAGKSTLMRAMNGLVPSTSGQVLLQGEPLGRRHSAALRSQQRQLGMVFQQFNLVRRLSALDNVLLGRLGLLNPLLGTLGIVPRAERAYALHLLDRVGLADHAWKRADQLSGGQQQRVGVARALAQQPKIILADEPISALDLRSSHEVMTILQDIQERDGIAVIANLHFLDTVRTYAGRVVALKAGRLVFDGHPAQLDRDLIRDLYDHETPPVLEGAVAAPNLSFAPA